MNILKRKNEMSNEEIIDIINRMNPSNYFKLLESNPNTLKEGKERLDVDYEEIVMYKTMGYSNVQISKLLNVSPSTIDRRVNKLKQEGWL